MPYNYKHVYYFEYKFLVLFHTCIVKFAFLKIIFKNNCGIIIVFSITDSFSNTNYPSSVISHL